MDWREFFNIKARGAAPKAPGAKPPAGAPAKPARTTASGAAAKPFDESKHPRDSHGRFISGGASHKLSNAEGSTKAFSDLPPRIQERILLKVVATGGAKGATPREMMFNMSLATGSRPTKAQAEALSSTLARLTKAGHLKGTVERRKLDGTAVTPRTKPNDKDERSVEPNQLAPDGRLRIVEDAKNGMRIEMQEREMAVYTFRLTKSGTSSLAPKDRSGYDFQHRGDLTRPDKFDIDINTPHGQFLASRREAFPGTKFGVMGRVFSSDKNAPEMTHKYTSKELAHAKDNDPAEYARMVKVINQGGNGSNAKVAREDAFKNQDFYDGTSSVNGLVGIMTQHPGMLKSSRLQGHINDDGTRGHSAVLAGLGGNPKDAYKPYFVNTLTNQRTNQPMDISSFKGLKDAKKLKEASKAIFTPGTYGSRARADGTDDNPVFRIDSPGAKAAKILEAGGMTREDARRAAAVMVNNFNDSPLSQFNGRFRDIVATAPEGFVYTNPMSGFKFSFDKYNTKQIQTNSIMVHEAGAAAGTVQRVNIPFIEDKRSTPKTRSGAAALFVQNWDSAVIGSLSKATGSKATLHDAIAIPKGEKALAKLHDGVVTAYSQVAKIDPVRDLVKQIKADIKVRDNLSETDRKMLLQRLELAEKNFDATFKPGSVPIKIEGQRGEDRGHFVLEERY